MDITANAKVSKAAAVHTENTYAQAYNAGKLYVVISLSSSEKGIASLGKEILERLQREFFALDVKNLETIKKAVGESVKNLPPEAECQIALATSVDESLYIITSGESLAILLRNGEGHIVALGEHGSILGFSGNLAPDDTVALITSDFLKIMSFSKFTGIMSLKDPQEISENLAPSLIENTTGKEAALILSLPKITIEESMEENLEKEERIPSGKMSFVKSIRTPKFNFKKLRQLSKRQFSILVAVFLILVLIGAIVFENIKTNNNARDLLLREILEKNEQAFEDAQAILSLNRSLAVEELQAIKKDIEEKLPSFPKNSKQYKELEGFLKKVEEIIEGNGKTAAKLDLFYEGNSTLRPEFITFKGGMIIASGNNTIQILKADGSTLSDFDVPGTGILSGNENNIYLYTGSSIYRIAKSNGATTEVVKGLKDVVSFDVFGNNIYILSETISRYRPNNFSQENYFQEGIKLTKPTSMSIDSSIYVLDNGKVRKFTRGVEDTFSANKDMPLSNSSVVYTDEEYKNIYILDPAKKVIAIIDKTGSLVKNLELTKAKNITSFAVNENDSKIYLVSDNNIYLINF